MGMGKRGIPRFGSSLEDGGVRERDLCLVIYSLLEFRERKKAEASNVLRELKKLKPVKPNKSFGLDVKPRHRTIESPKKGTSSDNQLEGRK